MSNHIDNKKQYSVEDEEKRENKKRRQTSSSLNNNNNMNNNSSITTTDFQQQQAKRFKLTHVNVTEREEPQANYQKILMPLIDNNETTISTTETMTSDATVEESSSSSSSPPPMDQSKEEVNTAAAEIEQQDAPSTTLPLSSPSTSNIELTDNHSHEEKNDGQSELTDSVKENDSLTVKYEKSSESSNNTTTDATTETIMLIESDEHDEFNVEDMGDEYCNVEDFVDEEEDDGEAIGESVSEAMSDNHSHENDPSSIDYFVDMFQLPEECKDIFKSRNIHQLYDWQQQVLKKMMETKCEKSLLYSLSTSAGKTLVSEFLLLYTCQVRRRNAMLVLPYVSIVEEKKASLDLFAEFLNFHVECYYANRGTWPVPALRDGEPTFVFITTIEKANTVINELLETDRLHELGCIVVDELHMIGDQRSAGNNLATKSRGILLESCLTKVNYWNRFKTSEDKRPIQIVGMSATIPNLQNLATEWLDAELYQSNFRPVPLQEHYVIGPRVFNSQNEMIRDLSKSDPIPRDRDFCIKLCSEVIPEYSCIVFCPTKRMCEQTVSHIGSLLPRDALQKMKDHRVEEKTNLVEELQVLWGGQEQGSNRQLLAKFIPYGIVFHHSGLTSEERVLIEKAFQDRIICVICATSTLAAGVNLPARRVLFRTPKIAQELLTVARYRQMAGRAGRAGIDDYGESYMIITGDKEEQKSAIELLHKTLDNCVSQSFVTTANDESENFTETDENVHGIAKLVLEIFSSGLCSNLSEVKSFAKCTLFWHVNASQNDSLQARFLKAFDLACQYLINSKIIGDRNDSSQQSSKDNSTSTSPSQKGEYGITPLGMAIYKSSFSLEEATFLSSQIMRAQDEGIILSDELHMCFLLTPVGDGVLISPNWSAFLGVYNKMTPIRQKISKAVGLQDSILFDKAYSRGSKEIKTIEDVKRELIAKRFYNALILCDVINEEPITEVAKKYGVYNTGDIQTLMTQSSMFSNMMHTFCSNLSWNCLGVLIRQFTDRIAYGVRAELLELAQISGVSASLARVLFNLGLKTQVELAQKTWKELLELVQNYTTTSNSNNQSSVRELIGLLTTDPESCVQGIVRDVKQTLNKKATQLRRLADECDQQIDDNYDDHSDVEEGTIIFDDSFDEGMTREGDLLPDF